MTANDRAFIKVSTELLLLRNDHAAMVQLASLYRDINNYTKERLREFRTDRQHSKGLEGFSKVLFLIGNAEELQKATREAAKKIDELEKLCEAYVQGRDIVAEKLSRDT